MNIPTADYSAVALRPVSLLRRICGFFLAFLVFVIVSKLVFLLFILACLAVNFWGVDIATGMEVFKKIDSFSIEELQDFANFVNIAFFSSLLVSIIIAYKTYEKITRRKKYLVSADDKA